MTLPVGAGESKIVMLVSCGRNKTYRYMTNTLLQGWPNSGSRAACGSSVFESALRLMFFLCVVMWCRVVQPEVRHVQL